MAAMCRHETHHRNEPFACFSCRKVFRKKSRWDLPGAQRPAPGAMRFVPCPQCQSPMVDMGPFFKAPRQGDLRAWQRLQELFRAGFNYYECDCCGPNLDCRDLAEAQAWVRGALPAGEARELLGRIVRSARLTK